MRGLLVATAALATATAAGTVRAQEPAGGAQTQPSAAPARTQPSAAPAPAPESVEPLSYRYRFIERYAAEEDPAHPEVVAQYHVAFRETSREDIDRPQGAPDRTELTIQTIYTERPARVGKLGEVIDAVRRYDLFRVEKAAPPYVSPNPALFRDLTIWYHLRAGRNPEVLSLVPGRLILQDEFGYITNGTQLILPALGVLLPRTPVMVGDSWTIPRASGQALLGESAGPADYELLGRLAEIRPTPGATSLTAAIEIKGRMELHKAPAAVNARLLFEFARPAANPATPAAATAPGELRRGGTASGRDRGIVDARGWISEVRMGRTHSLPLDHDGRLRINRSRQLVLQRRRSLGAAGTPSAFPDLIAPEKPPTPNEDNSWLVYDDPLKQYHLQHPQELVISPQDPEDPRSLEMVHVRPDGGSDLVLIMPPASRTLDPVEYRKQSDPLAFVRELNDTWSKKGTKIHQGAAGWLPDADWAPLKRRVYRYEAALVTDDEVKAVRQATRIFLDAYIVQFSRGDCIVIHAFTDRKDHVAFRDETEKLIRSLELGTSTPGGGGAVPATTPGRPSPSRVLPSAGGSAPPPRVRP